MPVDLKRIIQGCKKGNRRDQRRLYELYKQKMFVVCLRYTKTREDAEDVLQEGFIRLFKDVHQFKELGSFEGWMRKVFVNMALQHIRKTKSGFTTAELNQWDLPEEPEESVFDSEDNMGKRLIKLMQQMPSGFRTVLNLYIIEGYTHKEISEILDISVGTSKSQLNRAKANLKLLLEKNLAE